MFWWLVDKECRNSSCLHAHVRLQNSVKFCTYIYVYIDSLNSLKFYICRWYFNFFFIDFLFKILKISYCFIVFFKMWINHSFMHWKCYFLFFNAFNLNHNFEMTKCWGLRITILLNAIKMFFNWFTEVRYFKGKVYHNKFTGVYVCKRKTIISLFFFLGSRRIY